MNFARRLLWLCLLGAILFVSAAAARAEHKPDEVLVVYNADSPISTAIARYYMAKRQVTRSVAVHCIDSAVAPGNETIPFADYNSAIAAPVSFYLAHHRGINFIVLTKGIPILINGAPTGDNFPGPLQPSLDSFLAAIDYPALPGVVKASLAGSGTVGTAWINRYYNTNEPFSHQKFGGYLVTRLDGYTQADAMKLVDEALASEQAPGPAGGKFLFDVPQDFGVGDKLTRPLATPLTNVTAEASWSTGNADMLHISDILEASGIAHETAVTNTFVGNESNLLGYYSWGSNDDHFNADAYESLRFAPGSLCDTFVSTGARTFLPTTGGQTLIADLIAHGVTCCQGYAAEPILDGISSPTIDLSHYLTGYTMAESFYAATGYVGWEQICIGDPLCCPYKGGTLIIPTMAVTFTSTHGDLKPESCSESGLDVGFIDDGSYTAYQNVELSGATHFLARVAGAGPGGAIEVHIDTADGPILATCAVPTTGDWQRWQTVACPLTKRIHGAHTLFLVYTGGSGNLFNLEWFAFARQ
jgi:uncharacterized protein (TIGR03790 family)